MKKNKNGFTLVELMAVVVVLIIVLLIALNKVKDAGQKAHMNAIKSSAIAYRNAVRDVVANDLVNEGELYFGIFSIDDLNSYGVKVNGKQPTGGHFIIKDYKIVDFCIDYEDAYHVNYSANDVSDVIDGKCDFKVRFSNIYEFDYTGSPQTFTAPQDGLYFVELWGAQGGNATNAQGGKGAYTSGYLYLSEGDEAYIYVGGAGSQVYSGAQAGGYNGGGSSYGQNYGSRYWGSGGGATDIRLVGGASSNAESLASRIMVAAGGGGAFADSASKSYNGGAGGTLTGVNGTQWTGDNWCYGEGGTQVSGGRITSNCNRSSSYGNALSGSFGFGGNCPENCTGGGGGYYGGARSGHVASAGGGSSYISGYKGSVAIESSDEVVPKCTIEEALTDSKCSIHHSDLFFSNPIMKSGNETMPDKYSGKNTTGNLGNGYAKISLVKSSEANTTIYTFTGKEEKFIAPSNGTYKIEAWGAQGGSSGTTYRGGYGAYAVGNIELSKGDTLYINVGGKGNDAINNGRTTGGYNGGGNSYTVTTNCSGYCTPGGGASSVSLAKGLIKSSDISKMIIIAGGGGGGQTRYCSDSDLEYSIGGNAGGISGGGATHVTNSWEASIPQGGTQSAGGAFGTTNNETGGVNGSFGAGGQTARTGGYTCATGGGGGYYGGGNGMFIAGGGGSSYIASPRLTDKSMYCYDCIEDSNVNTKTISTTCVNSSATSSCAKSGSGFVKITKIN